MARTVQSARERCGYESAGFSVTTGATGFSGTTGATTTRRRWGELVGLGNPTFTKVVTREIYLKKVLVTKLELNKSFRGNGS